MEFAPPPQAAFNDPTYGPPPGHAANPAAYPQNYGPPGPQPGYSGPDYSPNAPLPAQQPSYNPADFGPGGPNVPGTNASYYGNHHTQAPQQPAGYAAARSHPEDVSSEPQRDLGDLSESGACSPAPERGGL